MGRGDVRRKREGKKGEREEKKESGKNCMREVCGRGKKLMKSKILGGVYTEEKMAQENSLEKKGMCKVDEKGEMREIKEKKIRKVKKLGMILVEAPTDNFNTEKKKNLKEK